MKLIELFVSAAINSEHAHRQAPTFAVVLHKHAFGAHFEELGRSETLPLCDSAHFCTSFQLCYNERVPDETVLRFELYRRTTHQVEKLREHTQLGKATLSLPDLLLAPGNHLTAQLSHPSLEKKVGVFTISAEHVQSDHEENECDVLFELSACVLRRRDWNKTLLHQRYELQRAHKHDDMEGHTVWLPIHRSDRIGKQRDSNTTIEFSPASMKYRHVCNGDDERQLKLSVYGTCASAKRGGGGGGGSSSSNSGGSGSGSGSGEVLLGSVLFCIRDICELDPTEEVLPLEGGGGGDAAHDVGHVAILKAEPTDYGSHFSLHVNFESCDKFCIGGSQQRRKPALKAKKRLSMSRLSIGRGRSSRSTPGGGGGAKLPAINSIEKLFKHQPTR